MVKRREINWRKLSKQQVETRPPVREERLKSPGQLVAWRGHSGKRYVFKCGEAEACQPPVGQAVMAAIAREDGVPTLLDVALCMDVEGFEDWRRDVMDNGATEIQVHGLCDTPQEAEAVVEDLGFEVKLVNSHGMGF